MQPAEIYRMVAFVGVVVTVYVLAARVVVRTLLKRRGWAKTSDRRIHVWGRRIVVGLAVFGTICVGYGFLIEPYWPEVTRVRITSAKLPTGTRPARIVHISDLHCDLRVRLERRLPAIIAREKPDLVVFTGDALNTAGGLPAFKACMKQVAAIAPTFAVRGNWDVWYWPGLDLFGGTGVHELNSAHTTVDVNEVPVTLVGVPVDSEPQIGRLLDETSPTDLRVFLYHYPDEIMDVSRHKADLYCAGHTHGGQLALPFYGALVTLSKFGKRFESGLFRVGPTWLYVNRGIGMEGGDAPRVRFCARPEVTVIDVGPVGAP